MVAVLALGIALAIPGSRFVLLSFVHGLPGLVHGDPWVRQRPLGYWLYRLERADPAAEEALVELGAGAVPLLRLRLDDHEQYARKQAATLLGRIGPAAKPAVPRLLITAWKDDSVSVRAAAKKAVLDIGPTAIPDLTEAIVGSERHEKVREFDDFLRENEERPHTFGKMAAVMLDEVCARASWESQQSPEAKIAVPGLIRVMKVAWQDHFEGERYVAGVAAAALGVIGPDAAEAVPMLIDALKQEDEYVHKHCKNGWRSEDVRPRYRLVIALRKIGPAANAALPLLLDYFNRRDYVGGPDFESETLMALPRIDPTGERIVPAFIGMLRGEDRHAAHALGYCWTFHRGTMSAALKASVPALLIASKSKDGTLRQEALDALKDIDPTALR